MPSNIHISSSQKNTDKVISLPYRLRMYTKKTSATVNQIHRMYSEISWKHAISFVFTVVTVGNYTQQTR